jgi:hypothetical protein
MELMHAYAKFKKNSFLEINVLKNLNLIQV